MSNVRVGCTGDGAELMPPTHLLLSLATVGSSQGLSLLRFLFLWRLQNISGLALDCGSGDVPCEEAGHRHTMVRVKTKRKHRKIPLHMLAWLRLVARVQRNDWRCPSKRQKMGGLLLARGMWGASRRVDLGTLVQLVCDLSPDDQGIQWQCPSCLPLFDLWS